MNSEELKKADWWQQAEHDKILCTLCPRYCTIGNEQNGFCYVRRNIDGVLYSTGYGHPTGFAIDPIEKKPLNHFYPASNILSFGTAGCNLGCKFCQNWTMSKARLDETRSFFASPEEVVLLAKKHNTPSIAFTYNDPTIIGEYVIDISKLARAEEIKNVMVTSGYIDKNARKDVYKYIDAANVDLKAFTEKFYHNLTSSHLSDVLDTLVWLKRETDVWFEITTLLIPGENDSVEETKKMCHWILENLGDSVPLHFTAFHPDFKMYDKQPTPPATVKQARKIAIEAGIKYCYTGNIVDDEGHSTYCPSCKKLLVQRGWHSVEKNYIVNAKCKFCGEEIPGRFK